MKRAHGEALPATSIRVLKGRRSGSIVLAAMRGCEPGESSGGDGGKREQTETALTMVI